MATTTNGLPYPVGTDRVADGDDAIRALAESLDPAWTAITLSSGWTARAGALAPAYRVIAGVVTLRGQAQKGSAIAQSDSPFTLPANARPSANVSIAIANSRASSAGPPASRFDIASTGVATLNVETTTISTWVSFDGGMFSKG